MENLIKSIIVWGPLVTVLCFLLLYILSWFVEEPKNKKMSFFRKLCLKKEVPLWKRGDIIMVTVEENSTGYISEYILKLERLIPNELKIIDTRGKVYDLSNFTAVKNSSLG